MWQQYLAVSLGAFVGMLYPALVRAFKNVQPTIGIVGLAEPQSKAVRVLLWLVLAAVIAAIITGINIVGLVTGDNSKKLADLGNWQYFLLASEGFGLAAAFEAPLSKT